MKKFALIVAATAMLGLTACESDGYTPPVGTGQPNPDKPVKPKPCNPQKQPGGVCPDIP